MTKSKVGKRETERIIKKQEQKYKGIRELKTLLGDKRDLGECNYMITVPPDEIFDEEYEVTETCDFAPEPEEESLEISWRSLMKDRILNRDNKEITMPAENELTRKAEKYEELFIKRGKYLNEE